MQCKAKSKQSGKQCKKSAVPGFEVCEIHGGKTPCGIALPQTRHGRYSKYLPARLAEQYEQSKSDPELLTLREDIALLDARLSDVMASASNQESGELWQSLKQAKKDYRGASGKDMLEKQAEALSHIFWLIDEGYQEWQSWKDIRFMLQERKQLVESERKRIVDMQQMISAERAMLLLSSVTDIIKTHIHDRDTLSAIAHEFRRLVTVGAGG
jgi:hypothetical protein